MMNALIHYGARVQKAPTCLLLVMVLGLFLQGSAARADVNVLLVGSTKDSTTSGYVVGNSKPFSPAQIKTELSNILAGANLGTVNVTLIDRGTDNNVHSLAAWYHYPYPADVETTTRWPNLRGELGTKWNYVVLIGDPYTLEYLPGLYAQGVATIAEEVAKGSAETVLLMPWPISTSSSTVDHYKEVVYRTGRSAGLKVAPAGLAWRDAGSPTTKNTHPNADGAYIAAASIYSCIWNQSAKISSYTYNDTLADSVYQTVTNNIGAQQYTGPFSFQSPFLMLGDKKRYVPYSHRGTSTERAFMWGAASAMVKCRVSYNNTTYTDKYYNNTPEDDGLGWPTTTPMPIAWNHGRSGQYVLNPAYWQLGFGFVYQSYTWDYSVAEANDIQIGNFFACDVDLADTMIRQDSTARVIPWRLMLAQVHKLYPTMNPLRDGSGPHQNTIMEEASGTYMYTLYSGRCPLEKRPEYPPISWFSQKIAYETAWRLGRCQARAPGFKVMPSASTALTLTPTTTETMSVQFILPPQNNVTVSVAVDTASAAIVNPRQLTFTPGNHDIAQYVNVAGVPGAITNEGFAVTYGTTSSDEVYQALSDSWAYTNKRVKAQIQALTVQSLADQQVSLLKNTNATISLNVAGSASTNTTIAQPINGTLAWSGADVIYTPRADYYGSDSFAYAVNVGGTLSKGYVIITVADVAKIAIVETDGDTVVTEGGVTDTYWVTLNKAPAAGVTVALTGNAQATVSPSSISFTTSNWNVPKTVTVTAVNDGVHELLQSAIIRHTASSSAPDWNGLSHDLTVTVRDNDNQAPVVEAGPDQTVYLIPDGSLGGAPIAGAHFDWDAVADVAGDDVWPSVSGNEQNWEFLDGDLSPAVLKDARFTKLTQAYSFPAARSTCWNPFGVDASLPATFEFVLDVDGRDGNILFCSNGAAGIQIDIVDGVLRGTVIGDPNAVLNRATYTLATTDLDRFIHVVCVVDQANDVIQLYVDGELKDSRPFLQLRWINPGGAAYWGTIGSSTETIPAGGSTADFTGKMALFRYYSDRAFTQQEVTSNFNSLSTGRSTTVYLDGTATDPNNDPLTHTWSTVSTTGLATFGNPSAIDTTATFTTPGVYTLRLTSSDGQETVHDELTVTVIGPKVIKRAMIYEPFEQDPGILYGQPTSGIGLNRNWLGAGSLTVRTNGLSYGSMPVRGYYVANTSRRQCNHAEIDDSLRTAGMLNNGAEVWFSLLHKIASASNSAAQVSFGLTSAGFSYGVPSLVGSGDGAGIGFRIATGDALRAAIWVPNATTNITEDSVGVDLVPTVAQYRQTVLIVGKITWGASSSALDKVELYLPTTNLVLGPVVSTVSATIDQSILDTLAIGGPYGQGGDCQNIDEIRVGANYLEVIGGGDSAYPLAVNNGVGSGVYAEGELVPVSDKVVPDHAFLNWTSDTATVANVNSASTTVTMPASAATVTANYIRNVTVNHSVPYAWLANLNPDWSNDYDAAVTNDPDADGFSTWQEYWGGTDPQNTDSYLKIDSVTWSGTNQVLRWQHAEAGTGLKPLVILASTNLMSGSWYSVGQRTISNGINVWSNSAAQEMLFYKLAVTNAP